MTVPNDNVRETWLARLGTMGDPTRLRLMRLLERKELGVGELARATRLPQSTVSRHLKALFDAALVQKRNEGTATLYVLRAEALAADVRSLWELTRANLGASVEFDEDDARLADVLLERRTDSRTFFGRLGGEWDRVRTELFGSNFSAEALLAFLDPSLVIADIGCGTGQGAALLAPYVSRVVAIDREPAMIEAARTRLADVGNVEFRQGDLAKLPGKNGEFGGALIMLVLHHVDDVRAALVETRRVLATKATLVIIDMVAHRQEEFRASMGHRHLGFSESDLQALASAAGFAVPRYQRLRTSTDRRGPGLFVASMAARA
ncbi:MAG: metalloregulator ArsR/SmtB family transcription factor [Phycisphaerae bacterium]|nr:metalloregulator ArsR/SmtB family transcription factor [Phycisphaerae bacterium]